LPIHQPLLRSDKMPFTPLHMGPAIAIKAVLQRKFSLMVFGWSQIVIDIQPLYAMLTDNGELHGFSHTYIGATILGLLSAVSGKYLGEWGLQILRESKHLPISWSVSLLSASIGTYSHVALDSIMHADVLPYAPFSTANPLYGIISIETLYIGCLATALFGGLIYSVTQTKN